MPNITIYLSHSDYLKFLNSSEKIKKTAREKAIKIIKLVIEGKLSITKK